MISFEENHEIPWKSPLLLDCTLQRQNETRDYQIIPARIYLCVTQVTQRMFWRQPLPTNVIHYEERKTAPAHVSGLDGRECDDHLCFGTQEPSGVKNWYPASTQLPRAPGLPREPREGVGPVWGHPAAYRHPKWSHMRAWDSCTSILVWSHYKTQIMDQQSIHNTWTLEYRTHDHTRHDYRYTISIQVYNENSASDSSESLILTNSIYDNIIN